MAISLFDVFKIGIGPSSSHTGGPMRAAKVFMKAIESNGRLKETKKVLIELFGSLAMTGIGHGTDMAILLGLEGHSPEEIDPDAIEERLSDISSSGSINLLGYHNVAFQKESDLIFHKNKRLPYHSNAMRFKAFDTDGKELLTQIIYSIGGGFIIDHEQIHAESSIDIEDILPYPFKTCEGLLDHCNKDQKMIHELMMDNEKVWRSEKEVRAGILHIWSVMEESIKRGCEKQGVLPGGLNVMRRAFDLHQKLSKESKLIKDPSCIFDWVSLFALAVNEENASRGRIVTAPTNGAAGIMPAVLHYYQKFVKDADSEGIVKFFLTAAAIGILYKLGASLSAAEMGCQGEVGVACSMAAAGLAAAMGGTNKQIENAAEIGMEHNLGLTCDPIGGLVQIPCIERNTMGAIKAINAARLALHGDGNHCVSLDQVIKTMRTTGEDMKHIYKETSEGGLALHVPVSVPEC